MAANRKSVRGRCGDGSARPHRINIDQKQKNGREKMAPGNGKPDMAHGRNAARRRKLEETKRDRRSSEQTDETAGRSLLEPKQLSEDVRWAHDDEGQFYEQQGTAYENGDQPFVRSDRGQDNGAWDYGDEPQPEEGAARRQENWNWDYDDEPEDESQPEEGAAQGQENWNWDGEDEPQPGEVSGQAQENWNWDGEDEPKPGEVSGQAQENWSWDREEEPRPGELSEREYENSNWNYEDEPQSCEGSDQEQEPQNWEYDEPEWSDKHVEPSHSEEELFFLNSEFRKKSTTESKRRRPPAYREVSKNHRPSASSRKQNSLKNQGASEDQRPPKGQRQTENQRPPKSQRQTENQRPPKSRRAPEEQRPPKGQRPPEEQRPPKSQRQTENQRPPKSRRAPEEQRPPKSQRQTENQRPPKSRRAPEEQRPPKSQRQTENQRPPKSRRAPENQRPPKSQRQARGQRPHGSPGSSGRVQGGRRFPVRMVYIAAVLVLAAGLGLLYYLQLPGRCVKDSVTIEAGEACPSVESFLEWERKDAYIVEGISEGMLLDHVQDYTVVIHVYHRDVTTTLHVVDTTPPVIRTKDLSIRLGDIFEVEDFVENAADATDMEISYKEMPDVKQGGTYAITLLAKDEGGNVTEAYAQLDVFQDTTPPVISGVQELSIMVGESVSYKRDVTVTDDTDEVVQLEIDNSEVNTDLPGDYKVVYRATDKAGNTSEVSTVLHVKSTVKPTTPDVPVTEESVNAAADKILASITDSSMTQYEVLKAIYDWCHNKIAYANGTPKTSWVEGAYCGIVQRKGDCYAYAMSSKCLLDRAGIVNMDIERIRVGNGMHFWNLVDIGEGWHHFDTCRRGDGSNFFYLTDAELMEYSDAHTAPDYPDGSHNYDRSLYPVIP